MITVFLQLIYCIFITYLNRILKIYLRKKAYKKKNIYILIKTK